MGRLGKVMSAGIAILWAGVGLAEPNRVDLVYTSDVRGTVGICG